MEKTVIRSPASPRTVSRTSRVLRNLPSAVCRRDDGTFFCTRGSVRFRARTHVHDVSRTSAPSKLCDRLTPPPPLQSPTSFLLWTGRLQLVLGDSASWVMPKVGVPIVSTWVMERQGLSPLPVPFPTFDACLGVGPQIRASSAPPGLRMPLPRHLYIPAPSVWKWPGRHIGSSSETGQPSAQLAPPPGPSGLTTGFSDMVGRPPTVSLLQLQGLVPGSRTSSPPTPIVSAACMPVRGRQGLSRLM